MKGAYDHRNQDKEADHDERCDHQARRDHPQNSSGRCQIATRGIHIASIHLSEVVVSHHPGGDAEQLTHNQTENSECENYSSTMRF